MLPPYPPKIARKVFSCVSDSIGWGEYHTEKSHLRKGQRTRWNHQHFNWPIRTHGQDDFNYPSVFLAPHNLGVEIIMIILE